MPLMRTLARFPSFDQPTPSAAAVPLSDGPTPVEPAEREDGGPECEDDHAIFVREPLAARLVRACSPRRRGLRQVRAGWGAIGFLALLAAGIWSFAWWQDHQAAEQARDAAVPQVAAVPLDMSEPIVR